MPPLPALCAMQQLASPEEQQRLEAYKALTSDKLRPSRDPGAPLARQPLLGRWVLPGCFGGFSFRAQLETANYSSAHTNYR